MRQRKEKENQEMIAFIIRVMSDSETITSQAQVNKLIDNMVKKNRKPVKRIKSTQTRTPRPAIKPWQERALMFIILMILLNR